MISLQVIILVLVGLYGLARLMGYVEEEPEPEPDGKDAASRGDTRNVRTVSRNSSFQSSKSDSSVSNSSSHTSEPNPSEYDLELYNNLKDWRDQVAIDQGVPERKVFSDKTLERIAEKKPLNKSALRYTKGVGPRRANKYGSGVLSFIENEERKMKKRRHNEIQNIIENKGIKKLYHFTDRDNLPSIRLNGGLYSWFHCENNGIDIDRPGGSQASRKLDREKGLENYVRLSFVKSHPMCHVAKREGRIQNPVVLEISPKVVLWEPTLFSDGNAVANRAQIGGEPQDLSQIRFDILRQSNWTSESEKYYWQAEVMVKKHVPLRYINNYL